MNWRAATGVFVIILLIAPVVSVSAQETMSNDEYEPNDEISSATDISLGEYTGLQLVSDENDYYAISVDEGETLNITATYPYQSDGEVADNEPALELLDSNGETLDYGEDDSDPVDDYKTDHLGYESDADQILYILVTGYTDAETSSSYDLTVERGENDVDEPNGVLGSATEINPGTYEDRTLLSGEHDYYSISVSDGETLNITATYPYQSDGEVADNEPALELLDSNGETLDYGEDDSDPVDDYKTDHLGYESDADQTLYILVTGYTDAETSSSYDLTIETNTAESDSPSTSEPTPADTATPVPDTDTPVSTQTSVYTTANEFSEETDTEYNTSQSTTMADDPEGDEPTSGSGPGFGIGITIITLATVILISLPRLE
jgi:hypothetical protein